MQCLDPKFVWRNPNGGRVLFKPIEGRDFYDPDMLLPCGHCPACAMSKKKDTSLRLIHEMEFWETGCTLTLTFDEAGLEARAKDRDTPMKWSVYGSDISRFIKRLRAKLQYLHGKTPKFRFYGVGEYGAKTQRPHYHILIFGWSPHDLDTVGGTTLWTAGKSPQHRSAFIESVWKKGLCTVDPTFTASSIAYVAGYVTKKLEHKRNNIARTALVNGKRTYTLPECHRASPGLGERWIRKHYKTVFTSPKRRIMNTTGKKPKAFAIPRYYYRKLEQYDPDLYASVRLDQQETIEELDDWKLLHEDPEEWDNQRLRRIDFVLYNIQKRQDQRDQEL